MVVNYDGNNFSEIIKKRVLIDFYANWCGPCKMLSPELEKISDEIEVVKINVDEHQDLAREYGVMSIPCVILIEDGKGLLQIQAESILSFKKLLVEFYETNNSSKIKSFILDNYILPCEI